MLASTATLSLIGNYAEGVLLQNIGTVTVYFSLAGGAADAIARSIEAAHTRMWPVGYKFTYPRIAHALAQAADPRRRIGVHAVPDQENTHSSYSVATYLVCTGMYVWIDWTHPRMHQKTVVIDDNIVSLGNMSLTRAGDERNSENWNMFRGNPQLAQFYVQAFLQLHTQLMPYSDR